MLVDMSTNYTFRPTWKDSKKLLPKKMKRIRLNQSRSNFQCPKWFFSGKYLIVSKTITYDTLPTDASISMSEIKRVRIKASKGADSSLLAKDLEIESQFSVS